MNFKPALILILLMAFLPKALAETIQGHVVAISDGDTITVIQNKEQFKVRLVGIDCPEKKQAFGLQAKALTAWLVFDREVTVEFDKRDRYGRVLGDVYANGVNVSQQLLKAGLAWHYRQYSKSKALQDLEDNARAGKTGLWYDPSPTPPWEFRKKPKSTFMKESVHNEI